jgi:tetratricopeptide (TPR) repeat protein
VTWAILLGAAALSAVAAAGVLWPFGGDRPVILERLADPLEDERRGLLRALRELEVDRATGSLAEEDYTALRVETESRAVAVLRALEARDGAGALPSGLREVRETRRPSEGGPGGNGSARGARVSGRRIPALVTAGAVVGLIVLLVPVLSGALRARSADQPLTGTLPTGSGAADPLAFFRQRVRDHPQDVAARLDLAQRFLQVGEAQRAVEQYLITLRLDPRNPEARASLGNLLYLAGKPEEALDAENKALEVDPTYPEALYFKGVILLEGLDRPAEAADAFRAYLAAAPFGSRRTEAQSLLKRAEAKG